MVMAAKETVMEADDRDPLALTNQLCFAVYSAAHAFGRRYKSLLAALGVTYPQYLCLLVLWQEDGLSVTTIGEKLRLDSGTLTPLLKRMEALGLVIRARGKEDERQVIISLTEKGRALKAKANAIPPALGCSVGMTLDESVDMKQRLEALRQSLIAASIEAES